MAGFGGEGMGMPLPKILAGRGSVDVTFMIGLSAGFEGVFAGRGRRELRGCDVNFDVVEVGACCFASELTVGDDERDMVELRVFEFPMDGMREDREPSPAPRMPLVPSDGTREVWKAPVREPKDEAPVTELSRA